MKKQFVFVAAIAAFSAFFSCKKSDTPAAPTATPAEGNWVGKYGSGGAPQTFYYAFQFNTGGTMVVKSNDAILPDMGTGTWTLSNDSIRSTYTYTNAGSTFSMIGKYDGKSNTISGTWGAGTSNKGGGTFTINRQ
ncbi:hypothetical protein [Ferruginibacter sp.]